jgi:hypothetical protein
MVEFSWCGCLIWSEVLPWYKLSREMEVVCNCREGKRGSCAECRDSAEVTISAHSL